MIYEPNAPQRLAHDDWEVALTGLLDDLLQTQQEMLQILEKKRVAMVRRDLASLRELQPREEELCHQLTACQNRRNELLALARTSNLPDGNLEQLSRSLPLPDGSVVRDRLSSASHRAMLLKHQSLTNWIIAQRNLLHISQLLENITTGGQVAPTYGKNTRAAGGFILDQEA
jgi:flagellar biosynthesis/type III secretory pathway chaperone